MPLKYTQIEGVPTGLYLALLAAGTSQAPATVTATLSGTAAIGANSLTISALAAAIPKNSVLSFSRAAGSPSKLILVTTADADVSDTTLAVEMFEGEDGAGLTHALASADAATWDGLYTVVGTENSPYSNNPQTSDLTAAVYGASSSVAIAKRNTTALSPQIARTGLFLAEGQLTKDILQYADTNRNWWCKQVVPDADGNPYLVRSGLARVGDLVHDKPADGLIRMSFTIQFINAKPAHTFPT